VTHRVSQRLTISLVLMGGVVISLALMGAVAISPALIKEASAEWIVVVKHETDLSLTIHQVQLQVW
jgi:hypothetical protein